MEPILHPIHAHWPWHAMAAGEFRLVPAAGSTIGLLFGVATAFLGCGLGEESFLHEDFKQGL